MSHELPITSAADAETFLRERPNFERTVRTADLVPAYKLERMLALCERLGNPQRQIPTVHIAGTKGKGSTASMLAAMLRAAGLRTALYTSPHLCDVRERIAIDGQWISGPDFLQRLNQIAPLVRELDRELVPIGPTYFEVLTAVAFVHFAQAHVDIAVMEVGLGGRLDATNVCSPVCCVVTNISRDHTRQLGRTLSAIASEKAGIIKPGVPVVTGIEARTAWEVVAARAQHQASPLVSINRDFRYDSLRDPHAQGDDLRWYMNFEGSGDWRLSDIELPMRGRHQHANAANALATCDVLRQHGWPLNEQICRQGLTETRVAARLEVVQRDPPLIIDTAHNEASIAATIQALRDYWPQRNRTIVLATTRGKDIAAMVRHILPTTSRLVLTQYHSNPRSNPVENVEAVVARLRAREGIGLSCRVLCEPDPIAAVRLARRESQPDELVCVTGSFYLVAEVWPELSVTADFSPAGLIAPTKLG